MTRPSILTRFCFWHRRYRTRRHLRDLPDYLLRDIGIDDAARDDECGQWFWQGVVPDIDDASTENGRHLRAPVLNSQ
ncbi:DUF1127 domain-containing protein [Pseudolabrys sp. FHR47]|uniref:DUF1127 domain-containing protein n=1 Tax=Pseudolabrys sp. FHR47 TaxID=2562284 RepID=UPI0010BE3F9A|nr:DUF1127 domain-containing protein [Pseudolabrys sp. FHR47]